jgi:hypothetical protein
VEKKETKATIGGGMAEEDTIKELALKFAEKNPDFVRDVMTSFNIQFNPPLEFNQGKMIKCGEIKKSYKL